MAGQAHNVAHVQLFNDGVVFGRHMFPRSVALDTAGLIHNMEKGHLAERAQRNNTPGHGKDVLLPIQLLPFQGAVGFQHPVDIVLFSEIIGEKGHARIQQIAGLGHTVFDHFVEVVTGRKTFQHGHKIARVRRLGAQLHRRLFVLLFPFFHGTNSYAALNSKNCNAMLFSPRRQG